jgi:hypothetical protein
MSVAALPKADLHAHSTASDGLLPPAALVELASRRGISLLALTDHDTTAGLAEANVSAAALGLRVIQSIELTTTVEPGELHILGYAVDPASDELQATLARLRAARTARAARMLAQLREVGIDLPEETITPGAPDEAIGRPHIARAMIARGVVATVDEAFQRYLGRGRPAYIPRDALDPTAAIQLIRRAGGLATLAHPFSWPAFPDGLTELINAGLGGLEVYYGEYAAECHAELATIAAAQRLVATGGSDYHGPNYKEGRELGAVDIPAVTVERFLTAIAAS